MSVWIEIALLSLLIVANGFFAGAEIAVVSLSRAQVRRMTEAGRRGAASVAALRRRPEDFLATIQVGITAIGVAAGAFGGAALAGRLAPALRDVAWIGAHADVAALFVVVGAISFASVVVGELVPKSLALRAPEGFAAATAPTVRAVSVAARPVVRVLAATSNLLLRPLGGAAGFGEQRVTVSELRHHVREAHASGDEKWAVETAGRALDFAALAVRDVMVPRARMLSLAADAPPDEVRRLFVEGGHARLPVHGASRDDVLGYVAVSDVLGTVWATGAADLRRVVRPVRFVAPTTPAVQVLRDLQRARQPLAMVVDDHGGVVGLVTLRDLLEEIVGEMLSEHERPEDAVVRETSGALLVAAHVPVRELNRDHGFELPEGPDFTTVAGLCLALSETLPPAGTVLTTRGATIEIAEATPRAIRRVRLRRRVRETDDDGGDRDGGGDRDRDRDRDHDGGGETGETGADASQDGRGPRDAG